MKRWIGGLVVVGLVASIVGMAVHASGLFDRAEFIAKVRQAFEPIEYLLNEADAFDYEEAAIFSGVVNGSEEHVVFVPLTQASVSFDIARHLGEDTSWADIESLPLFGFYMLPPTDCIHTVEPDVPYLVRGISWDRSEVVDGSGVIARLFVTWWRRGEPAPAYCKFSGNWEIHIQTCTTASSNQL